jgi:hypothetical protein
MLKVGETYKIKMWEDSEDGGLITELPDCKVTEAANTLVKIQQGSDKPIIINTASIAFVSAERQN